MLRFLPLLHDPEAKPGAALYGCYDSEKQKSDLDLTEFTMGAVHLDLLNAPGLSAG